MCTIPGIIDCNYRKNYFFLVDSSFTVFYFVHMHFSNTTQTVYTNYAQQFRGARVGRYSQYEGMWRPFGYGMYAIHGSDALTLQMDEDIVGWGGEDNDFHKRCSSVRHIVRMHEPNLIHL